MTGTNPEIFDDLNLRVLPGTGVVHRGQGSILVVPEMRPEHTDVVTLLIGHCRAAVDPTGKRLFRRVVGVLADTEPDLVPPLCLLIDSLGDVVVLAQGDVAIDAGAGGRSHHLRGASSLAWVEQRIEGPIHRVLVVPDHASPGVEAEARSGGVPFDLRSGTVPGGGAILAGGVSGPEALEPESLEPEPAVAAAAAAAAAPVAVSPPAQGEPPAASPVEAREEALDVADGVGSPDTADLVVPGGLQGADGGDLSGNGRPSQEFESVLLTDLGAEEQREPLPVTAEPSMDEVGTELGEGAARSLVEGALCSRGHFNDPSSAYCSVCGISMLQRTRDTVLRPRPSLGVLVVDDGSAYTITSPYVLGRTPENDDSVVGGEARALVLDDETHSVSRVHAILTLDGWRVLLTDRGSSNGTYVSGSGEEGSWTALVPNEATPLGPRTHVRVGKRHLVFDSYHAKAGPP